MIAIIGAGAAGLMAAATLCIEAPHIPFTLIDRNSVLGSKVRISGGGRCNVTTGIEDLTQVLKHYPRGARFLKHAMYAFPPKDVMDFFQRRGVLLKTEADMRVFPVSNSSADIMEVFENLFEKSKNCTVKKSTTVTYIKPTKEEFEIHFYEHQPRFKAVILATGGTAYRHTGSQGDGYSFAELCGHSVTPIAPSLFSIISQEKWPANIAGVSLPNVRMRCHGQTKKTIEWSGPILFTHKGITGPGVFAFSSQIAFEPLSKTEPLPVHLDFLPEISIEDLTNTFKKHRDEHLKKNLSNYCADYLPRSVARELVSHVLAEEIEVGQLSNHHINQMVQALKDTTINAIQKGAGDEFVSAGGIPTKEVDSKTMESRKTPNLFITGELLDVDGFTGGFNLQCAWTTGRAAGLEIVRRFG